MAELLENSDNTNVDTGVSESPANEATISLSAAQALADALQKIEAYTPTAWVDNESPDIDAAHLNKAEQAIMRVTTAMNSAVDVIKDLQSQVNTTNNNLSNRFYYVPDNITLDQLKQHITQWNQPFAFEINYASPISPAKNNAVGIAERGMLHAFDYSGRHFYCTDSTSGWQESPYALKSDLFASGFILDPSTCTVPFSIVNGWNSSAINIPEVAKNKQSILLTIWVYGTVSTGKLDATRIQALIVGQGGGTFTRIYDNSTWSDWA